MLFDFVQNISLHTHTCSACAMSHILLYCLYYAYVCFALVIEASQLGIPTLIKYTSAHSTDNLLALLYCFFP